mgnify:CR=1 FL=1
MQLRRTELYGGMRIAELFEADESTYGHTFGGPVQHHGAFTQKNRRSLHLLYFVNTEDPVIPFRIPGLRRVPLYYCFDLASATRLGYRVTSESRIETFPLREMEDLSENVAEFPYQDFPDEFPEQPIVARRSSFDPANREHVREYIDVFWTGTLSRTDRQILIDELRNEYDSGDRGTPGVTDEEVLRTAAGPTCQGHPESACPNPDCSNHSVRRSLQITAVVPAYPFGDCVEHDTLDVFSPWGEQCDLPCSDIEIVYELCPNCWSFMVTNQIVT